MPGTSSDPGILGISTEVLLNSPEAWSRDVRSSGVLDGPENQPPGKKREEVVDSSRLRPVEGERVSISAGAVAVSG